MPVPHQNQNEKSKERTTTRRELLANMGAGMIFLRLNDTSQPISLAEARKQTLPLRQLRPDEVLTLEAFADVLLPGSALAGIAHYIDDQLGRDTPLLFLKYTDYNGPYDQFYKSGLQALDRECVKQFRERFHSATHEQQTSLVRTIAKNSPEAWDGPPAPLFYFVLRNDAVDVYYGTPEGFEKLGVPHLALIRPPTNW